MGSKLEHAIETQDWEVAARCLIIGFLEALEKDQELQVTLNKLRVLRAQDPGVEVPLEVTRTLERTAFIRTP